MHNLFKRILKLLPDRVFIDIKYYAHFHRFPNLNNPKTFNEKIQWLKLNDRRSVYTTMVDKFQAKEYISKIVGAEYTIPTIGVWNSFDEIDFSSMPNQFVLKTTHDCGGIVICKNKDMFDKSVARSLLEKHLREDYFYEGREWPYKNVQHRIIAEPYIENTITGDLKDYKIFAFDGQPRVLFVASDRQNQQEETKFDFYDMEFRHLDIQNGHPNSKEKINVPSRFEEMKRLAALLSKGIPNVRVDFYEANGKLYVGELTLFHYSGFVPFRPDEWDYKLGSWISLPIGVKK